MASAGLIVRQLNPRLINVPEHLSLFVKPIILRHRRGTLYPAKTTPIASGCRTSSPLSNITSTIMGQMQEDMSTAMFDITQQCFDLFDLAVAQHDEAILTHSFVPATTSDNQTRSSCDFLGLRNSFLFWVDYTGALSLMNSSLDAILRGSADIFALVIELLEMILRNLHRGEFDFYPTFAQMDRLRILVCLISRPQAWRLVDPL